MLIQQYPFGLTSLLNAKSSGATPAETEAKVGPVVDFSPFYYAAIALTSASGVLNAQTVAGSQAVAAVPAGQAWQVIAVQATLNNGTAGNDLQVAVRLQPPDGTFSSVTVARARELLGVAGSISAIYLPQKDLIVGPGTVFQARLEATAPAAVDITVRVLYRPLPI